MNPRIRLDRAVASTHAIDGTGIHGIPFNIHGPCGTAPLKSENVSEYLAKARQFFGDGWSSELENALRDRFALAQQEKPWGRKGRPPVDSEDLYQAAWSINDELRSANTNFDRWLTESELKAKRKEQAEKVGSGDAYKSARAAATISQIDYLLGKLGR